MVNCPNAQSALGWARLRSVCRGSAMCRQRSAQTGSTPRSSRVTSAAAGDWRWRAGVVGGTRRDLSRHAPSAVLEPPVLNVLDKLPKRFQPEVRKKLRALAEAPTRQECERRRDALVARLRSLGQLPAIACLERD